MNSHAIRGDKKATVALFVFMITTLEFFDRKILLDAKYPFAVTLSQNLARYATCPGVLILTYLRVVNETDPT